MCFPWPFGLEGTGAELLKRKQLHLSVFFTLVVVVMQSFLEKVGANIPTYVQVVKTGLTQIGFVQPTDLAGADESEVIAGFPSEGEGALNPAQKAFVRRAIRLADKLAKDSDVPQAVAQSQPTEPASSHAKFEELFGVEVSAESVAEAMRTRVPSVEVQDVLTKASCAGLPPSMLTDVSVWQAMSADTEAARKKGKVAFTYVDFTSRAMLPPWLPQGAVGGKKRKADGGPDLDPDSSTSSLQNLSIALQNAMATPRILKSNQQWVAVYLRYAPMAVGLGQWTWSTALAHMGTVTRLAELERYNRSQGWVAIQYDAQIRQSWARRALQGDPDLDIPKECLKIDEEVLSNVRAQIKVSASDSASSFNTAPLVACSSSLTQSATEGALAKSTAAAQAVSRRAEQAAKELAKAEQSLAQREEAMRGGKDRSGKGNKGKGNKDKYGKGNGNKRKFKSWNW